MPDIENMEFSEQRSIYDQALSDACEEVAETHRKWAEANSKANLGEEKFERIFPEGITKYGFTTICNNCGSRSVSFWQNNEPGVMLECRACMQKN